MGNHMNSFFPYLSFITVILGVMVAYVLVISAFLMSYSQMVKKTVARQSIVVFLLYSEIPLYEICLVS